MSSYFEILCGVVAVLLAVYYYGTCTFDFWKNRGVVGPRPLPYIGNIMEILLVKKSAAKFVEEIYAACKNEPMVGLYTIRSPALMLREPELIKDVLVKNFSTFSERGYNYNEKVSEIVRPTYGI